MLAPQAQYHRQVRPLRIHRHRLRRQIVRLKDRTPPNVYAMLMYKFETSQNTHLSTWLPDSRSTTRTLCTGTNLEIDDPVIVSRVLDLDDRLVCVVEVNEEHDSKLR